MIDISKLTDADKERNIVYDREFSSRQYGKLSSWNDSYVFVRFKGPNGEACEPADVSFECDYNAAQNALGSTDRGENGLYGEIGR